jgi:hypothetical protein
MGFAEGRAGQRTTSDGAPSEYRLTRTTAIAVAEAHGRYMDAVLRGRVFMACQQAAAALGTALTATVATICLYNPSESNVNLVLLQSSIAIPVGTTAGQLVYAVNDTPGQVIPVTTTALTPRNALLGSGQAPVGRVFSIATLPANPVAVRVAAGIISTTPGGVHGIVDDVGGAIILGPNTAVTLQGITTNATGQMGILWEEVPI